MINERLAQLLARKLSGEATQMELEELHQYLQDHQDDQYFVELLSIYWYNHHDKKSDQDLFADQKFQLILELAQEHKNAISIVPKSRTRIFSLKVTAAVVFIGAIITTYFLFFRKQETIELAGNPISAHKQNEVETKAGARSHVLLPDGSQVWLNSASKLTYDELFVGSTREVKLEGEGYFEIVKDPSRPFIVHTDGIDVRVLGTTFNLKSYPKESTVEAVLLRGMLEVINTTKPNSPKVILKAHEKIVFNKELNDLSITGDEQTRTIPFILTPQKGKAISPIPKGLADSAIVETSWVYNKLLFDGETFEELAIKMERWFNVSIRFKNEKVKNYKFSGAFTNENIQQALDAMKLIHSFDYKINKNEVEIYGK